MSTAQQQRRTLAVPSIADCVFIMALLIATLVWARPALNTDGDAGRHIRVGETILDRGGLFYEDLFSHTMAGERFVPYEWLSETLAALAHRAGGLPGVVILHGLVVATAWGLLGLFLRRRGVDPLLAFVVAVLAAAASAFHWLARPHVFTFAGTAALLWLLEARALRESSPRPYRILALVLLLFAVWANLHGGFLFGLVLIAMYVAGDLLEWRATGDGAWRTASVRHAGCLLAAVAGAAINPSGLSLFAHVTGYLGKTYLVNVTNEYMSPDFHLWFGRAFLLVLVVLVAALAHNRRRLPYPWLTVLVGTFAFALHSARNIPLFALTAMPLMALHFDADWRALRWPPLARLRRAFAVGDGQARAGGWAAAAAAAFLVIGANQGNVLGVPVVVAKYDPSIFPVDAVGYARDRHLEGRLFNNFIWGGYILYAWPEQRVFIDGQTDFYGEALTRAYGDIVALRSGWREELERRQVSLILVPGASSLSGQLAREPGWQLVYRDSTAVLYAR